MCSLLNLVFQSNTGIPRSLTALILAFGTQDSPSYDSFFLNFLECCTFLILPYLRTAYAVQLTKNYSIDLPYAI